MISTFVMATTKISRQIKTLMAKTKIISKSYFEIAPKFFFQSQIEICNQTNIFRLPKKLFAKFIFLCIK